MAKLIAIIGGTGAQGIPVIRHLLAPKADGSPSEYKVRALTRNPEHRRAKEIEAMGAELVKGDFMDSSVIHTLFKDAYGAFVNTDGFTVGEAAEMLGAITIWEIARLLKVRHFVWSNLDYVTRISGYNPTYAMLNHYNAKGRFADFLAAQPNDIDNPDGTMWTNFTNGPYMDMLYVLFAPMNIREDGTRVWIAPMGDKGTIPMIALDDLGWWVRHIFDDAPNTTGKNFEIASQMVTYPEIVETFQRVTGLKGEYKAVSMDEYFALWNGEIPVASAGPAKGTTWETNFRAFFATWRDCVVKRDMDWIASVHPPTTMEKWMKDNNYDGVPKWTLLKNSEDDSMPLRPNMELLKKM